MWCVSIHPSAPTSYSAVFLAWKPSKTVSKLMFINMVNCTS